MGTEARRRAQERAGSARIPDAAWWPEIELMINQGLSTAQIAAALQMSERRIRAIKSSGTRLGTTTLTYTPENVRVEDLSDEFKAMLEFTADGFERFYNYASGKKLPAHCKEWVEEFINNINLLLNVPPRHAKTTIFAVWVPIWLITIDRDHEILIVSKTIKFAKNQAAEIAYHLKHNRKLIEAFGRYAPENEKGETPWRPGAGELMVLGRTREAQSGQLSIQSKGYQSQILGNEATVVICDDVTDQGIAKSEPQREEQLEWLREQVFTRLMQGGHAVVVGQRVHNLDLYGVLAAQTFQRNTKTRKRGELLWKTISHPAVLDWDKEITLWPDFWDFESLMEAYERVGHSGFECMYQQNPLPLGTRLVDPEWWPRCRNEKRNGFEGMRLPPESDPLGMGVIPIARVMSLDPSPTKYNGFVVADVPYQRDAFSAALLEIKHWAGGMRSIIDELTRALKQYHPDYLIVEHSTFTGWLHEDPLFQELARRTTVLGHNTGKNKGDPILGAESLGGDIEFGRIDLPYGDEAGRQMSRLLESEMDVWPDGTHDDCMMALWFIKFNYKRLIPRGVLPTSFSGREQTSWRMTQEKRDFDPVRWYRSQKANG